MALVYIPNDNANASNLFIASYKVSMGEQASI